jgi:hypothetical protein
MFRKFLAVLVALMFVVGGLFADEIKGVFKKIDGGKVTIEVDGTAKDYKVSSDAKVKIKDQEVSLTDALGKWKDGQKGTFTVDKDTVTKAKKDKK